VLMIERLPWMHYLLQQGIRETKKDPGLSLTKKLSLQLADSHNYLSSAEQSTDVVYLDPMFPNAGSARAKKNIQALRDLTEEDQSDDLLPLAISFAKKRVIVKRHKNSEYLNQHKPTFSISGRVIRFDVYEI
jgi:16S rRNA (guanine1516-N2)-methyltransferase